MIFLENMHFQYFKVNLMPLIISLLWYIKVNILSPRIILSLYLLLGSYSLFTYS